jgi:hypothetical protein
MRHEDAALQLWLASDAAATPRERLLARAIPQQSRATIRQRAGAAVIAVGEWLAGDPRPRPRQRRAVRTA